MSSLEREIFDLVKQIDPQTLYRMGLEELGDVVFIPSKENIENATFRIRELKKKCARNENGILAKKFLASREAILMFPEPLPDIGLVSDTISTHLIKEGINPERMKKLIPQLVSSLNASMQKFEGKTFSTSVRILVQYQILSANETLDIIEKESRDIVLLEQVSELRERVLAFGKRFAVNKFTQGEFDEVMQIMREEGADLARSKFYPTALKLGFDFGESPKQLETKAVGWIAQDLPKLQRASRKLALILDCPNDPESVSKKLKSVPGVRPEDALRVTLKIRPMIQALVAESIVGVNPYYNASVVETPPYLSPLLPTGAAQDFDSFTDHPSQRFYITTDPKRAPVGGFAELVNLLVHEEYGHCLHASNTSASYAAKPTIVEILPSLHGGSTSEGLSFQRELEFLNQVKKIEAKLRMKRPLTKAEREYVELTREFGGFDQTTLELEFSTMKQRIIRFLRVIGDARINSGKQDLLEFLDWAKKKTGLSERTVFFQIFPAHEGIFPGYATCYAVVGQEIREIQKPFKDDRSKLVKFNSFACSMGYPARSVYSKRLKEYAKKIRKSSHRKGA
ncbi:MAG: hypothetical protein ACYCQJ_07720 [Nitrososphaerales archaeon]